MYDQLSPPDRPLTDYESSIYRECLAGFPMEQERISEDVRTLAYYALDGGQFVSRNAGDDDHISIESTGLTKRCVDILTSLSYSPPPSRQILDDEASDKFLNEVYQDNKINSLLHRADVYAHLLGFAAVEAVPAVSLKPVRLYLWNASELIVRGDEDDCTAIGHVITRDTTPDGKIRLTWWSRDFRIVFVGRNSGGFVTSGGRSTQEVARTINPYGRLPFGFIHHQLPVSELTTPGVGEWLADQEAAIDEKRYQLSLGMKKYLLPKAWVGGVTAQWQPTDVVGEFMRMPAELLVEGSSQPNIGYLQAQLSVDQAEAHIDSSVDRTLTAIGVPLSIYRMDQTSTISGDAIEAEQKPLVDYTRARQETLKVCENDVAEAVLAVGGAWLKRPELSKAGQGGANLTVSWPEDIVQIPGVDQDTQDANAIAAGYQSTIDVIRRRYRLSSDEEAVQRYIKVRQDQRKIAEIDALLAGPHHPAPSPVVDPGEGVFTSTEIAPSGALS
ncbi:hypothetical protein [Paludisphaera rhizosphaerae]|uniref:hypothetical protein n=1 Tax=Paludisphaera rhizosphaerae TaxID=2711216 RepID=UPI0013EA7B71|nr:hypothetical protein [Paludisphaera rhizosphaerae]